MGGLSTMKKPLEPLFLYFPGGIYRTGKYPPYASFVAQVLSKPVDGLILQSLDIRSSLLGSAQPTGSLRGPYPTGKGRYANDGFLSTRDYSPCVASHTGHLMRGSF